MIFRETHHARRLTVNRSRFLATPAIALAACTSADAPTAPSLARGGSSEVTRAISGECDTEVTILSIGPDGRLDLRIDYTCRLSHLGLTHNTVIQSVIPSGPPVNGLLPGIVNNTGAYVAANGDRINSSFTGTGLTNLADFSATFEGTESFSGGTGRFADASGSAHIAGTAVNDVTTGTGTAHFTLEGTITY
jgi:hypothetical protein